MLFGEGRCGAFRHRYLEYVQGVADQGVVADETDHLDQAGLAQGGGCLVECRVRKPPGVEELGADPVDKGFVLFHKARGLAATDRLDRGRRNARLLGQRRMRKPLVLRAPKSGGGDDRELGKPVWQ